MNSYQKDLKTKLLQLCDAEIKKHINQCESWSKSDDRGACYYYQVDPLRDLEAYIEKYGVEDE